MIASQILSEHRDVLLRLVQVLESEEQIDRERLVTILGAREPRETAPVVALAS